MFLFFYLDHSPVDQPINSFEHAKAKATTVGVDGQDALLIFGIFTQGIFLISIFRVQLRRALVFFDDEEPVDLRNIIVPLIAVLVSLSCAVYLRKFRRTILAPER